MENGQLGVFRDVLQTRRVPQLADVTALIANRNVCSIEKARTKSID
jgi:hypothetical protein